MADIRLENIEKRYPNGFIAVHHFSLHIPDKAFMVLLGPTGCGKSTVLRMIAGLEDISEGTLYIDNKPMNHVPPKERNMAMVFQDGALYPHMTVYENIAFALAVQKMPTEEIDARVAKVSDTLHITHLLQQTPTSLSEAQSHQVSMGRALVREPDILLMNKSLSHLEGSQQAEACAEMIALHKQLGITFVYVTQNPAEAMTLGLPTAIMKNGTVQQVDVAKNLYNKPNNLFVAGFTGLPPMNMVCAMARQEDGRIILACAQCQLPLNPTQAKAIVDGGYIGKEVVMGIRPADMPGVFINDGDDSEKQDEPTIKMTINPDKIHIFNAETELTIVNQMV